ncbi:hypothetical protein AArcSl_3028 [Halalkaliarchaeum desulfuricum]|uniref:DUF7577 domain-containing protein n=2 Tax=Halalkaliarchaeum desulfuricum TaxID=2055893 RepID=A0A343TNG7_9EURY|nr:hypothetical protein AArcSl_3028 [Halalkaliarchaeum desulfuricum]
MMPDANQLLLLAVAVGLLHVIVFALVMRWSDAAGSPPAGESGFSSLAGREGDAGAERSDNDSRSVTGEPVGPSLDTDEATVRCPACGAENEAAYQYCRLCVSQLHGGAGGAADGSSPTSDRMGR